MKTDVKADTIVVKTGGWVTCPFCRRNQRLMKILPDTVAKNLQVYCRECKHEMILNIDKGQRVELRSQ